MRIYFMTRLGVALFLVLAISSATVNAQAVSGNIDGTVTDTSGAAVPGASVLIESKPKLYSFLLF